MCWLMFALATVTTLVTAFFAMGRFVTVFSFLAMSTLVTALVSFLVSFAEETLLAMLVVLFVTLKNSERR